MRLPWRRQQPSPVEEILRENRPEPRPAFTAELLSLLDDGRRRRLPIPQLSAGRAFAAVSLSLVALVGATVAAGGPSSATHGLVGFVNVGNKSGGGDPGKDKDHHHHGNWGGDWQYTVPICHKKNYDDHHKWEVKFVKRSDVRDWLHANPWDFIITPWHHCPPYDGYKGK